MQPMGTEHAEIGPRVVVVDDDPDILNIVVLLLTTDSFRVAATSFIEEAIAMLDAEPAHLLITDLRLGDGNGINVIRHAAQLTPRRPEVILLTAARAPEEAGVAHLLASINAIIVQKPFDIDYLLDLARSLTGWPGSS
jgi:two-component system, NtrC family, response regulator PilR